MQATSYIITYRSAGDPARRRNLETVLRWLGTQRPAELIVVEQDAAPTLDSLGESAARAGCRAAFAYNPGPFNKSWGLNVGWRQSSGSVLVFGDADTVCRSLPAAVAACRAGVPAVRPFNRVVDLNTAQSEALHADPGALAQPGFGGESPDRRSRGEKPPLCGGIVVFQRAFFELLGGWDERFVGWGGEDDAMDIKLRRAGIVHRSLDAPAYHLEHQRANAAITNDPHYRNNLALLHQLDQVSEVALKRLCEVGLQLAGHRERHRPTHGLQ